MVTIARLLAERNVALLLGAGIVSEIGDWFNIVALVSLSYSFGDGALGVGGMFAARMVTRLLCQGPAGAYVDRHASRRLLFTSQLIMAVVASSFVLLVMVPELWLLYLLVILLEVTNCIVTPAFMVELKAEPHLPVRGERLSSEMLAINTLCTRSLCRPVPCSEEMIGARGEAASRSG